MASFAGQLADALEYGWESIARPNQLPPPGDWSIWLLLAGRGFGKTRVLSEMANGWATTGQARRIGCAGRSTTLRFATSLAPGGIRRLGTCSSSDYG